MRRATLAAAAILAASACGPSKPDRGPVTVTLRAGGPVVGAEVLFLHADGAVAASVASDAQGQATAVVERGGSVTVAQFTPGSVGFWMVVTFAEVEPGDDLVLDPFGIYVSGTNSGSAGITYPGPVVGAVQYGTNLGCSGSSWASAPDPVSAPLFTNCGSEVDAIAMARDGRGQLAWSALAGVPITGTAPNQAAALVFGPWRSDQGTLELTATDPPAGGGLLTTFLRPSRAGRSYVQSATGAEATLAPPQATVLSIPYARDFWTSAQLSVGVVRPDGSSTGLVENGTSFASRTVDLAATLPPSLTGLALSESGGRRTANWTRAAPDAGLDGTVLGALWGDGSTPWWWWRVILPAGRSAFTFPAPPAGGVDFAPAAGVPLSFADVTSYDVSTAASFADFRRRHAEFIDGVPELGPTTVRFTGTVLFP